MMNNGKLKKDPVWMYSDIPIDPYPDLRELSPEELRELLDRMIDRDVEADSNPTVDKEYETNGIDREQYKIAIENELKRRGL